MPRLSLSMIVRDEERHLARALETARLYADEIVVVDTGSKDATRELATKLADRVLDFVWTDDFAAARNFAADHCTGDFVMWLDADDVVPEASAKLLRRQVETANGWDLLRVRYELGDGRGVVNHLPRVWRNGVGIRWTYPVHELLDAAGRAVELAPAGIRIVHAPIATQASVAAKHERNLRILRRALESTHRDSAHLWFHLAKELRAGDARDQEQALAALRRALELEPERGTFLRSRQQLARAEILRRLGRDDEALEALGAALGEFPLWREPFFVLSEILRARRQWSAAVGVLRMASLVERPDGNVNRVELYGPEWPCLVSVALEEAGDVGAALEEVRAALRRTPDDEALLAREVELTHAPPVDARPPKLLAVDLAPRELRRGETFEATFTIHTRAAHDLALELALVDSAGRARSDAAHDVVVPCPPGESRQRRLFTVPADTPAGTHELEATLRPVRGGRLGKSADRFVLAHAVTIR